MAPPCARPDRAARQTKPTRSEATEAQNPADHGAREGRHQNHGGLHSVVLIRVRRDPFQSPSEDHRGPYASQRLRRWRVPSVASSSPRSGAPRAVTRTTAVCIRSSSSASAGIPSSRLRKTTAARMRRSDFAGGGCLRSRRRRRGVVLPGPSPGPRRSAFDRPLRRPPGSLPAAFGLVVIAAVLVALVHVRELQRVVHPMHPKRRGKRRSRSRRRRAR